jgi:hypothetical protein
MAEESKQQFNVYLSPELIRRVKHAAVDDGLSLSAFLETVLREHLAAGRRPPGVRHKGDER